MKTKNFVKLVKMSTEPRQSEIKYLAMMSDSEALKYFKSIDNKKFIKTHKRTYSVSIVETPLEEKCGVKRKREN